jgi:hypothetical protein
VARYTSTYGYFLERTSEVALLVGKARMLEKRKDATRHGKEIDALCRGAVVLLSSHVEGYVKELGECTLDAIYAKRVCRSKLSKSFFYHISKHKIETIRDSSGAESISASIFHFVDHESIFWSLESGFPEPILADNFNKGFSNPKFDKVKSYLSRFGYEDFKRDFFKALTSEAQAISNSLDQLVDTRNAIAHGETSAKKTPHEVQELLDAATKFCRNTDIIFANWCKDKICTIR